MGFKNDVDFENKEVSVSVIIDRYSILKNERSSDVRHRSKGEKSPEFIFYAQKSEVYRTKAKRLRKKVRDIMYPNSCGYCHICTNSKILIRACGNDNADCVSCKECYIANMEAQKIKFILSQGTVAPFSCMYCKSVLRGDTLSSDEIENLFNSDEFRDKAIAQNKLKMTMNMRQF